MTRVCFWHCLPPRAEDEDDGGDDGEEGEEGEESARTSPHRESQSW